MPPAESAPEEPLTRALSRNIQALEERRERMAAEATAQDRVTAAITDFMGSLWFVYLHVVVFTLWIAINLGLIPFIPRFDPSFVSLAIEASVEAIFISTFVLISQNRSATAANKRADLDLHINLLSEYELTKLAHMIEAIAIRLDVKIDEAHELEEVKKHVAPEAVLDELSTRDEAKAG